MEKPRVFLDSSVIISALMSSKGGSFYILTRLNSKLQLQMNNYVLDEVIDVISRKFPNRDNILKNLFILIGLGNLQILDNPPKRSLSFLKNIINTDDQPILLSAIKESGYLVTLDNHFFDNVVIEYSHKKALEILKPKELIEKYR